MPSLALLLALAGSVPWCPLILLSPACPIYSAEPVRSDDLECSSSNAIMPGIYLVHITVTAAASDRHACARPVGEDVQIRCSPVQSRR